MPTSLYPRIHAYPATTKLNVTSSDTKQMQKPRAAGKVLCSNPQEESKLCGKNRSLPDPRPYKFYSAGWKLQTTETPSPGTRWRSRRPGSAHAGGNFAAWPTAAELPPSWPQAGQEESWGRHGSVMGHRDCEPPTPSSLLLPDEASASLTRLSSTLGGSHLCELITLVSLESQFKAVYVNTF